MKQSQLLRFRARLMAGHADFWLSILVLCAVALCAVGCANGVDAPGNLASTNSEVDTSAAEGKIFESNIKPILKAKCTSCHMGLDPVNGPDFFGPDEAGMRDKLVANSSLIGSSADNSLLVLKGQHKGPAFNQDEALKVSQWIVVRAGGDPSKITTASIGKPGNIESALGRFGACMTPQDWLDLNVNQIAQQQTGQGQCSGCHNALGGVGAVYIDDRDPYRTAQINRTRPFILKLVKGTVDDKGNFDTLVKAYRWRDKGQDPCVEQPCHPEYQLQPPVDNALNKFLDKAFECYNDFSKDPGSLL